MSELNPEVNEHNQWLQSLETVYQEKGIQGVRKLLQALYRQSKKYGVHMSQPVTTPYVNTIPEDQQPPYPGRREYEQRIKSS